ncbi:hypothetical protein ACVBEF_17535 [Glaciimonas sp. GG7]
MPFTNASEPSPDDSSDKASQQRPIHLTDIQERFFLLDYARLLTETSQGITAILDIIEANELYQSKPDLYHADVRALAIGAPACEALQQLALITARLLGSHAVQEVELIDARSEHRRTQEKAEHRH